MAVADVGRVWFLAISMKVCIKSWKSTAARGPGTGADVPGVGVSETGIFGVGEPTPLGVALSFS